MKYQRIEDMRIDSDLTIKEISAILECHRDVYSRYEKGIREIPVDLPDIITAARIISWVSATIKHADSGNNDVPEIIRLDGLYRMFPDFLFVFYNAIWPYFHYNCLPDSLQDIFAFFHRRRLTVQPPERLRHRNHFIYTEILFLRKKSDSQRFSLKSHLLSAFCNSSVAMYCQPTW